jgi:hypothetical protein
MGHDNVILLEDRMTSGVRAEQARAADRPCRCAQDRAFFEGCFPDLSNSSPQGRRLMRNPFGSHGGVAAKQEVTL